MLAVTDTSALHYLILIQQETLLPALYGRVVIPPAVSRELLRSETPDVVRQWLAHPPDWLTIQAPQQSLGAAEFPKWLLLDSRVVDMPRSYNSTFVTRSSLKPFFFNGLKNG